jgi:hypothetical protein
MIETLGLASFNPSVTLKEIAKQIGDRDNGVRNAALNTVTIAFQICGEQVYKYIGKINEKELSMLDERIKRSGKSAPVLPVSTAQQPATSQPQVKSSASGGALNNFHQQQQNGGMHPSSSANAIGAGGQQPSVLNNINNVLNNNNNHGETGGSGGGVNSKTINRTPKKYTPSPTQPVTMPSAYTTGSPQQGGNGYGSAQKPRREFTLDLKDDDDDMDSIPHVKLTAYKDIDELISRPVELPAKRTVISRQVNILKETSDVKEAIDLVITHISHHDIETSIQNLLQV